jgi:Reverse transcriptase (RNA-dependent DNA polymerase)/Retroviral aspartyl protease
MIYGLIDTGSNWSFISRKGLSEVQGWELKYEEVSPFMVIVADGNSATVSTKISLAAYLKGRKVQLSLFYLPSLAVSTLLGLDFLRKEQICFDCSDRTWWFKEQPDYRSFMILHDMEYRLRDSDPSIASCGVINPSPNEREILDRTVSEGLELIREVPGLTSKISHKIDTGDATPIRQRSYRYSPKVLDAMYAELDNLIKEGKVECSHSAWASPVVMVRKGDGYRMTIDFRKVNSVSRKDSYPMPNLNSLQDSLRQARYLSKLDLCQAFLQVPLEDEHSRDVTSFIVPGRGLFRYRVMPFGLSNSPATFQRLADSNFGPELYPNVIVFLDDILICTPDIKTHCYYPKEVNPN